MTVAIIIKAVFGVTAAVLYAVAGYVMIDGATGEPGYTPGGGVEYVIALCGAAMTAFVAAQIGVTVAAPAAGDDKTKTSVVQRLDARSGLDNGASRVTVGVLIFDVVVLFAVGIAFVWLFVSPGSIAVPEGADKLKEAPDYISLQAKAFIALVVAGAGGVGVAAAK